jgi:hypothetical protein
MKRILLIVLSISLFACDPSKPSAAKNNKVSDLESNLTKTGFMWHAGDTDYKFEQGGDFQRYAASTTYDFPSDIVGLSKGKWAFDKNKAVIYLQFTTNYQRILQIANINNDGTAFEVPYDGSGEQTFIQSPILINKFE